ncbi:NAD-dependent epimerase/dehydratase family protein [Microlunatus sp. Y2014]|uniref:NAD-dependent epimerase/dehydratase family protein n=1 Tax=Microlunatus sp. Y2014 TaxID=3418488 RepID=UPI003DA73586
MAEVSPGLAADMGKVDGDLLVIGAAGKLGPSLVNLACRAVERAGTGTRVYAASRFSEEGSAEQVAAYGAEVVTADVSDDQALANLPDVENVIFLVGTKFGTQGNEHATWATNTYLPGRVAQRFAGSRIAALSTGGVYPVVPADSGGSRETDDLGPVGEYAMSCLGRERVLTHVAHRTNTPMSIIRLNYAVEMRYGVLVDMALKIKENEPINITTAHANVVWQGYCNEVIIRSLLHASVPPLVLNLTGPETFRIRDVAEDLAAAMGRQATFSGTEGPTSFLSNASTCHELFGLPRLGLDELITATAEWIENDHPVHGKPTHFETRDGQY